jgi:galactokinase
MKDEETIVNLLQRELAGLFGQAGDPMVVRSPGRINLIGEHTDYNNGFVLPSAIDRAIYLAIHPKNGFEASIHSIDFDDGISFDVRNPVKSEKGWANYLIGTVNELNEAGHSFKGFDCVFCGNIPIGAGMSSSAALEAGLAYALDRIFALNIERFELARIAQRAENNFVGVKCGIMDQFANLFSRGESVLHLDCRSMEYEHIPFTRKDLRFVLCDTGVKHSLATSEYNQRRQQCEAGVKVMTKYFPGVRSLRDVTLEMLREHMEELGDTVYNRCSYVAEENARVDSARKCLQSNDYVRFGELLYKSHQGLRDKYEVSCAELDLLVDEASRMEGVLGARMMGGGFGGCTLNLVELDSTGEFKRRIRDAYLKKTGNVPQLYECSLMPGTDVVPD